MASRAIWSQDEIALLERHANERRWFNKVRVDMPSRTEASIRKQMHKLRTELGIIVACNHNARGGGDNWQERAVEASRMLYERTIAVGRWS